ncbi:diguanylate cyclase/phosphodiesterase (GGDEF & EAL domains) with PAS/PAC sensor(s) [Sulfuriferula multivorans]|uniref:Diguanylate cyclase/phosphodiesterase (GGDEF & EAL domains) with PAS/PAC sensor(S) n=1 Tax=Sulfuriferula multivorans TaxID=1559896 RepID=A0A401JZN0_9PROT|nr:EAL domain-containing protein [Sulfuriferula multivorans]GCB02241.1 diguanylate cyclase/phosphodiesterase (GGDEF & EAL domains) with PAS/PAC sensor(s) [Sulfuriferula multivorans]
MSKPQIRVLVVEDDAVDRMACRRALARDADFEFVIAEAETGGEGLRLAHGQKPDCVLLDFHLPDMNGLEFLAELRNDLGEIPVPVMMLTGADNASVAVEAMKRGAQDYLVKDVNRQYLELLPAVIQRVLRERRMLLEKQHAENKLAQAEAKYRSLVEQIPAITYTAALDVSGKLLYVSPQLEALGYLPEEWIAEVGALRSHVHPDDQIRAVEEFDRVRATGKPLRCEYRLLARNGAIVWFRDEASVVRDEAGNPLFLQGILVDISESKRVEKELREHRYRLEELVAKRTNALTKANEHLRKDVIELRRAEEALFQEKERAQVTLESIGDAVITTDAAGRVEYLNPVAAQFTGWSSTEAQGQPLQQVFNIINETSREPVESPVDRCLREGHAIGLANHSILLRRDGSELAVADTASPIHDRHGKTTGVVMVFHNVTQERKLAQQLSYQATHDALTGLINRRDFEQRLERALANARADGAEHALCYLDLDRFKVINDTCGHAAGDQLLRQLSALLLDQMRSRDTLARLGGDEFGLLLEHCHPEQAMRIAEELLQAVQQFKFVWEGKVHSIGASIGVVPVTAASESLSAVLRAADAACYTAKGKGRNRVYVYQIDEAELAQRNSEMQWVARITQALEEDRFGLFCQPIAELVPHAGERVHYEILLRMLEPDGRVIAPEAFLAAAERYNLMPAIDRWVVRRVISWLAAQPPESEQRAAIYSINLSGASLADHAMLDFIREQLILNQVPGNMLGFEIAEATAIANLTQAAHFFHEIRNLGCRTTLDNFGSAMFSIASLNVLQMDYLKIDGYFVKDIAQDRIAQALVDAINQVAHEMSARTVAGWTESPASLGALQEIGVDHVQGYVICRPRPLAELGKEQELSSPQ